MNFGYYKSFEGGGGNERPKDWMFFVRAVRAF